MTEFCNLNWITSLIKKPTCLKNPDKPKCVDRISTNQVISINPIQDGGQKAPPPTSFSPVTSTNVGISSQNLLTFSFNPHLCKISIL